MPTATDLVTDLPADFEVFGQAVDTDFVDLLGGTTGQILSKTSATDLDFTWIANDQGDITGVTAGNGITVTSPTGPVPTVAINTAVTADLTTAQTLTNKKLSDSTTTIVDVSDPTKAIKFDVAGTTAITGTIATAFTTAKTVTIPDTTGTVALTNGVVNNTLTTTTGDIIYASAANTPARLGIGSASQVLSVSGGIPAWSTPSTGAMTLISTTSFSAQSSQSFNSVFSATYNNYKVMITTFGSADTQMNFRFRASGTDNSSANYNYAVIGTGAISGSTSTDGNAGSATSMQIGSNNNTVQRQLISMDIISPFSTTSTKGLSYSFIRSRTAIFGGNGYGLLDVSGTAFDGFTLIPASGTLSGTVSIYGMSI